MDPRIARIRAANRMTLPRLASDALADALTLIDAYSAEVAALRQDLANLRALTALTAVSARDTRPAPSAKDRTVTERNAAWRLRHCPVCPVCGRQTKRKEAKTCVWCYREGKKAAARARWATEAEARKGSAAPPH